MFDFSIWELVLIGSVALVVIGPERLPRVARTAGHLLGRFQRYVSEVKADIGREIELAELKKLQTTVQDAARDIEQSVKDGMSEAEKHLKEAEGEVKAAGEEIKKTEQELSAGFTLPHMGTAVGSPQAASAPQTTPAGEFDPRAAALNPGMAAAHEAAKQEAAAQAESSVEAPEEPSPQLELGLGSTSADAAHKPS